MKFKLQKREEKTILNYHSHENSTTKEIGKCGISKENSGETREKIEIKRQEKTKKSLKEIRKTYKKNKS